MMPTTIIGIIGPGKITLKREEQLAYNLCKAIAQQGRTLLTGGRPAG